MIHNLAILPPLDKDLALLTYDPQILEQAVLMQRATNSPTFPSPDELMHINMDYQMQCRIYAHLMDYGIDYHRVPGDYR